MAGEGREGALDVTAWSGGLPEDPGQRARRCGGGGPRTPSEKSVPGRGDRVCQGSEAGMA